MSDDETPTPEPGGTADDAPTGAPTDAESAGPWVTGAPVPAQRVPGILETQDTTYVEPEPANRRRRAIMIGLAIGLGVVAAFAVIVLSMNSTDDPKTKTIGAEKAPDVSTTSSTTTTTTTAPGASTTSTPAVAPTAPPATAATTTTTVATPRATSDPAAPLYIAQPLPAGVSGTLGSCSWQPAGGGHYEASGTLTNGPSTTHGWIVTMHWLQNGREIGQQSGVVDIGAGQSAPWSLAMDAPVPPADPFSCALSAA
jgi:hypothetical protein